MWVTQTYLRSPDLESKLHIYYLFEDYNDRQKRITSLIQRELAALGKRYGREVTLYMPELGSRADIIGEIRGQEGLWSQFYGRFPGLLILDKPMEKFIASGTESLFVPFVDDDGNSVSTAKQIAEFVDNLVGLTDRQLNWIFDRSPRVNVDDALLQRFGEAIEVKPGIFGINFDLRRFLRL